MNLITRCPACQTSFRVVPDQLRISEGWVRCGRCQQIFDANAALVNDASIVSPKEDSPAQPASGPESLEPADAAEPSDPADPIDPTLGPDLPIASASAQSAESDLSLGFGAIDEAVPVSSDVLIPTVLTTEDVIDLPLQLPASIDSQADPVVVPVPVSFETPVAASRQEVSFLRQLRQPSLWQRTPVLVGLAVLAVGLTLMLAVQGAVHERDRIAAMFPQVKPALAWICQQMGCTVSALRQIEAVVIDSSSLNKLRADTFRLALVLRNTSTLEIAMPSIELTLTDSQDQPVLRRVLLANEFSPVNKLDASSDWTGGVAISVRGNEAERFAGYKVLAFYP
jgi:predicted Zn finger-like uncharacterized protein